jgi:ABC-type multidrug transport system permease subunit
MTAIQWWWLSLLIGGVVVVAVAVLLMLIIAAAKRIDRHAGAIWIIGKQIAGNTVSIVMLEDAVGALRGISQSLGELQAGLESLDRAVGGPARPS